MLKQVKIEQPKDRRLSLKLLVPWLILLFVLALPVVAWTGAYDPSSWQNYVTPWPDRLTQALIYLLCGSLFILPLIWVLRKKVFDILALALAQNALIFSGYFYLGTTAEHLPEATTGILEMAGLVVLFNAVGFLFFFLALYVVYTLAAQTKWKLPDFGDRPRELDKRLLLVLRGMSLFCALTIALPMVISHTIPLFSQDNAEARLELIQSDTARALYHLGSAMLPFVVAGLILTIVRLPARAFGWDGLSIVLIVGLQLLTSNRLPLSLALMVTLSLLSMQFSLSRWLLFAVFVSYFGIFTFFSGFTFLLRGDPHALEKDWFFNSIEEAYLGDNIIDLRDGAWVMSRWDFEPLMGKTYMGGALAMLPSGIFPEKKQWHLGLTGVRIVGMPDDAHFGLRITFFGEAFLNFGWAGVVLLATILGSFYGLVLRQVHLAAASSSTCSVCQHLLLILVMELGLPLANTSDAFIFWALLGFLLLIKIFVLNPVKSHVPHRA